MTKFTFKREPRETGLASVGADAPSSAIKLRGVEVGLLKSPTRGTWGNPDVPGWRIRLKVCREPTPAEPCPWKWVGLVKRYDTEQEARDWLQSLDADAAAARWNLFIGR